MMSGSAGQHERMAADVVALLTSDPIGGIDAYLQLNEDRDLDGASAFLAPGATLHWPGGVIYGGLREMVAAAAGRYRWVRKHRDQYAVGSDPSGRTVVTSRGRLYGENLHGVPFDDVRYVDVFVLDGGRIIEQHVWNDFPLTDVLERTSAPGASGPRAE